MTERCLVKFKDLEDFHRQLRRKLRNRRHIACVGQAATAGVAGVAQASNRRRSCCRKRGVSSSYIGARLVDGMLLLDIQEMEAKDGRTLTLLLFISYRIAGVDYECSQDITAMRDVVNAGEVRAGFPCSVAPS